jgi:hypothetical protein
MEIHSVPAIRSSVTGAELTSHPKCLAELPSMCSMPNDVARCAEAVGFKGWRCPIAGAVRRDSGRCSSAMWKILARSDLWGILSPPKLR